MNNHPNVIERFEMIVCPYPFIVRDGKILLTRRKNTGYMSGWYSLPAGHEEENERMIECLTREVKEEAGIIINPTHPKLVHVMHRKEEDVRMDLFFLVTEWVGTPTICEPDKCEDIGWFALDHVPKNTVPYIRVAIEAWQRGILYQEWGWSILPSCPGNKVSPSPP